MERLAGARLVVIVSLCNTHGRSRLPASSCRNCRGHDFPITVSDRPSQSALDASPSYICRSTLNVAANVSPATRCLPRWVDLDSKVGCRNNPQEIAFRGFVAADDARPQRDVSSDGGHLRRAGPRRRLAAPPPPPPRRLPPPPVRGPREANSSMSSANLITPLSFPPPRPRLMFHISSGRS